VIGGGVSSDHLGPELPLDTEKRPGNRVGARIGDSEVLLEAIVRLVPSRRMIRECLCDCESPQSAHVCDH
jgi:hypothetical protein